MAFCGYAIEFSPVERGFDSGTVARHFQSNYFSCLFLSLSFLFLSLSFFSFLFSFPFSFLCLRLEKKRERKGKERERKRKEREAVRPLSAITPPRWTKSAYGFFSTALAQVVLHSACPSPVLPQARLRAPPRTTLARWVGRRLLYRRPLDSSQHAPGPPPSAWPFQVRQR